MSKREHEGDLGDAKKLPKKNEIAIDSELLTQQDLDKSDSVKQDPEASEAEQAAAAAAAAVAATDSDAANAANAALNSQSSQQIQQQIYQNAFRQEGQDGGRTPDRTSPYATSLGGSSSKLVHGSDEWHKQRRENHKEVERRRRESINHGIKELAALIPTADTNKSQILQRAVDFIKRLKENETNNIEKWTLEKLITEQAVTELSASNDKLKQELERAYREIEHWKRIAEEKEEAK